jgi:hypothetical protein
MCLLMRLRLRGSPSCWCCSIAACQKLEPNSWSIYLPERSGIISVEPVV